MRQERTTRPRTVGVVVDTNLAHGRGVLKGITAYGLSAGWRYRRPGLWSFPKEPEIRRWQVDGLITAAHTASMCEVVQQLGVPAVDLSGAPLDPRIAFVTSDDEAIGRLAAEHLLDRGVTVLAFVGQESKVWSRGRAAAFQTTAAERGVPCHLYSGDPLRNPSREGGEDSPPELYHWLANLPTPTGVFAANDQIAEVILRAAREIGRKIPEELAVIGVDDDELIAPLTAPPLSSIDPDPFQVGIEAAKLLDALMSGAKPPANPIRVPPIGVVTRASSDIVAIDDAEVAAAVRFIRDRANLQTSVADVVAAVPLSRRPLEKRFRKLLGRSILEEIHRVHVERAKQLLAATDLQMPQVARASGFPSATRLGIVFRQGTGTTPSAYRMQFHLRR